MDEKFEAFRKEVLQWRGTRRKGARPYTAAMKAKALQLAKDLQAQGLAMGVVAKRIGICAATLYLWQSSSRERRMVSVAVVRPEPQVVAAACFALVSPRGCRLEGVPVKLAVAMLQELGYGFSAPSRSTPPNPITDRVPTRREGSDAMTVPLRYLTTAEAAEYMRYKSPSAVRNLKMRGLLRPDGRRGRAGTDVYLVSTLDRFLAQGAGTMAGGRPDAPGRHMDHELELDGRLPSPLIEIDPAALIESDLGLDHGS